MLAEVLGATQLEELDETGELNVGVPITGLGTFRLSAFRQRGTIAWRVPLHADRDPGAGDAQPARHPGDARAGKARSGADGRRHRHRQEHHDGLDDPAPQPPVAGHILTIEDPIEFLFTNQGRW